MSTVLARARSRPRNDPVAHAEFAALDFETTGLDPATDHVISFGVVPIREGRIVLGEALHELVDSPVAPSPDSVKIHGLRSQDLALGLGVERAREVLGRALGSRSILAWHAPVEIGFLTGLFGHRRRIARRVIDVRLLAIEDDRVRRETSPARPEVGPGSREEPDAVPVDRMSLTDYAGHLGVPVASPHDALDDALVTAQAFLILASRLPRRGPSLSVGELLRLGRT
jgi:DNA polymerase III subunit epsilon